MWQAALSFIKAIVFLRLLHYSAAAFLLFLSFFCCLTLYFALVSSLETQYNLRERILNKIIQHKCLFLNLYYKNCLISFS